MRSLIFCCFFALMISASCTEGNAAPVINLDETLSGYSADSAKLSPDGTMVVYAAHSADESVFDQLCLYNTRQKAVACEFFPDDSLPDFAFGVESFSWSHDSQTVAFTENFSDADIEPDIWIFDIQNQSFLNITDDEQDGDTYDSEVAKIDLFPVWSSDGSLYFQRLEQVNKSPEERLTSLRRLTSDREKIEFIVGYGEEFYYSANGVAHQVSPDGRRIVINVRDSQTFDGDDDIYLLDTNSSRASKVNGFYYTTGTYRDDLNTNTRSKLEAIVWANNRGIMFVHSAQGVISRGKDIFYNYYKINEDVAPPLLRKSNIAPGELDDIVEIDDSLRITHRNQFPVNTLLSPGGDKLYYVPRTGENAQMLLSLPLPPKILPDPVLEFALPVALSTDSSQQNILNQMSSDGRYGLYAGVYLIEFAVNSE